MPAWTVTRSFLQLSRMSTEKVKDSSLVVATLSTDALTMMVKIPFALESSVKMVKTRVSWLKVTPVGRPEPSD